MKRELKLRGLRAVLGIPTSEKETPKGYEFVAWCPNHTARIGRLQGQLNVNVTTDVFHCWSCGWKGRDLMPIFRRGAPRNILEEYQRELDAKRPAPRCIQVWVGGQLPSGSVPYEDPKLPDEFIPLTRQSSSPFRRQAFEYLKLERGLTDEVILQLRLGYCEEGSYCFRIIVPSFDADGDLNFSVGRLYAGPGERYKHERISKDVVYNDWAIDWTKPLDVVEGPFDHTTPLMAGVNATCLLGSELHHELLKKIVDSNVPVYSALDGDAFEKQMGMLETYLEHGVESHYVPIPNGRDPGKMTPEEYVRRREQATPIRDRHDLLRLKLRGPATE